MLLSEVLNCWFSEKGKHFSLINKMLQRDYGSRAHDCWHVFAPDGHPLSECRRLTGAGLALLSVTPLPGDFRDLVTLLSGNSRNVNPAYLSTELNVLLYTNGF